MPRARNPKRDKAYEIYKEHKGSIELVEIASKLKIPAGTIRGWKNKDRWDDQFSGTFQIDAERSVKNKNTQNINIASEVKQVLSNKDLNDKQKLFCLHYIKCFSATKAYQKAYGVDYKTAASIAYRLLENDGIRSEILRLKQNKLNKAFLEPEDIFQKYMDIAYADVTDFLEFGREEVQVMTMYGPLVDKETKKPVTKTVNTVRFKESSEVDGTILTEVKQGKDGASIKLADRMKALDWLTDHMNMATEEQKAKIAALRAKVIDDDEEEETGVVMIAEVLEEGDDNG